MVRFADGRTSSFLDITKLAAVSSIDITHVSSTNRTQCLEINVDTFWLINANRAESS